MKKQKKTKTYTHQHLILITASLRYIGFIVRWSCVYQDGHEITLMLKLGNKNVQDVELGTP